MSELEATGAESPAPPAEEKLPWGFWPTAGFGALTMVASFTIQLVLAVVFVVFRIVSLEDFSLDNLSYDVIVGNYAGLLVSVAVILSAVVCIVMVLAFIKTRNGPSVSEYLALRPVGVRTVLVLLLITVGFLALSSVVGHFTEVPESEFMADVYLTSVWPPLFWLGMVVFAPLFEEILFRGFLFEGFRRSRLGVAGAVWLPALLWAVFHVQYGVYEIATIFVLGIILGVVRYKTGSLWSPVIIHALNNLAAMILLALGVTGW